MFKSKFCINEYPLKLIEKFAIVIKNLKLNLIHISLTSALKQFSKTKNQKKKCNCTLSAERYAGLPICLDYAMISGNYFQVQKPNSVYCNVCLIPRSFKIEN